MSNGSWQTGPLGQFDIATRFLTTFPLPWPAATQHDGIARALPFFPLVGAMIGMALLGIGSVAGLFWPPLAQAALIVVAWGILTGGLHLDGVSDTFDALMSWRPRERKLEIMKDSRIGAMGALALLAVLLLKVTLLASAGEIWWCAVLSTPILGRWAMISAIARFPPARADGLGSSVQGRLPTAHLVVVSSAVALAVAGIAGVAGLCGFLLAGVGAHILGRWWTHELGGLTGDTYGAICELTEVIALATLTATARFAL
jgi:adenosylcobinamide-GDP ribazoletransferase